MASVYPRNGYLLVDFRYRGIRCRERTRLADTQPNRRKLQRVVERVEAEILLKTFNYANYFPNSPRVRQFQDIDRRVARAVKSIPTFGEFAEAWYVESAVGWRHSYREMVRNVIDHHLLPTFGDRLLDEISKADVLQFRAALGNMERGNRRKGLLAATINRIMGPLRSILNEAASRYEYSSSVRDIKSLKVPRTNVEPFTLDEVHRFLEAVREDFRPYYTVRFFTGMRTGEIDGLKWKYVDFERRQILVRETFVMGQEDYTKNDHSQREITMSAPVYDALREQLKRTKGRTFVFCNAQGKPWDYHDVSRRVWHPLLRHLGLATRKPYQTRHTAATLWLAAGENPEWIARQMGHATTEMLFRVYSRYVPNLTRRDGSAFEDLLKNHNAVQDEESNESIESSLSRAKEAGSGA